MNRGVSIPLRNTQFDRIRAVSCAVNRPRRRAYPKMSTFPQSLHKRNLLLCAGGGFPGRAAQGLSLLLYSPGSHGGHIKWPPAHAELATNLTPVPPGPGIRRARWGNVPCQKGTGLFWSVLSGEMLRSSGDLLSSLAWKSAAFSEVCGKL